MQKIRQKSIDNSPPTHERKRIHLYTIQNIYILKLALTHVECLQEEEEEEVILVIVFERKSVKRNDSLVKSHEVKRDFRHLPLGKDLSLEQRCTLFYKKSLLNEVDSS